MTAARVSVKPSTVGHGPGSTLADPVADRPVVSSDLSGHILHGAGPWGVGPVNVRGRSVDGRVWAAVATPSGAIADPRAAWFEVPPTWGPLADLLRVRSKSGLV